MRAAGLLAAGLLALGAAPAPVSVVHVFRGQDGPNPPDAPVASADMMGGVSDRYLVGLINGGFTVRSKRDGKELQPYRTLRQFWEAAYGNSRGVLPGNPYDPRILFDPASSRWFALCDAWGDPPDSQFPDRPGPTQYMLIAVSSDDDPRHPWKAVHLEAPGPVDNIKLGVDARGVYSSAGYSRPELAALVVAVPKADLLWRGETRPSVAHVNWAKAATVRRLEDHKLDGAEGLFPALDLKGGRSAERPVIFINRYRSEVGGETIMQVRKLTWTLPHTAVLSEPVNVGLGVRHAVQPTMRGVQPPLPSGLFSPGLNAGEGRVVNAVVRHGSVWAIAATQVGERVGAFWVEIDLASMKLRQHGTLGDTGADLLFPSLSVDAEGNLGIAMTRTSVTEPASTYVTGRRRTDPPNTLRPLTRAVAGRYVFFQKKTDLTKPGQPGGTSDYSTTVVDPSDRTLFWSYQLAATNDGMPPETNAGKYGTNWVAFRVK